MSRIRLLKNWSTQEETLMPELNDDKDVLRKLEYKFNRLMNVILGGHDSLAGVPHPSLQACFVFTIAIYLKQLCWLAWPVWIFSHKNFLNDKNLTSFCDKMSHGRQNLPSIMPRTFSLWSVKITCFFLKLVYGRIWPPGSVSRVALELELRKGLELVVSKGVKR